MADNPWDPPGYEPPALTDPWECAEPGCGGVAAFVINGRPTCGVHKEEK